MEWPLLFSGISAVAASVSALCSIFVVYIAFKAMNSWKKEHLGKFSFEVGYALREALNALKQPLAAYKKALQQSEPVETQPAIAQFIHHYDDPMPAFHRVRDYVGKQQAAHLNLLVAKLHAIELYVMVEEQARNKADDAMHVQMLEDAQKHHTALLEALDDMAEI